MADPNEQTIDEQRLQAQREVSGPTNKTDQSANNTEQRHYVPIRAALPTDAAGYEWKRETGDIQSYQHNQVGSWLHIDPQGQFYDRHAQPIPREHALHTAGHSVTFSGNNINPSQSSTKVGSESDLGFGV